jgi:hypothetical protein
VPNVAEVRCICHQRNNRAGQKFITMQFEEVMLGKTEVKAERARTNHEIAQELAKAYLPNGAYQDALAGRIEGELDAKGKAAAAVEIVNHHRTNKGGQPR